MSENKSPFRRLENYKAQHSKTAETKGIYEKFMSARTLTRARGILFGFKSKNGMRER